MGLFSKKTEEEKKEEEEKEVSEKDYDLYFECENCGEEEYLIIKKGIKVEEDVKDKICPNCGCKLKN